MAEVYIVVVGSNNQAISVSVYVSQVNFAFLKLIEENWFSTTQILRLISRLSTFNFYHTKVKNRLSCNGNGAFDIFYSP